MQNPLRLIAVLTALALSHSSLRAESTTAATPAAATAEPMLIVSLPANLKSEDVVGAVAKAFTQLEWKDVSAQNGTVAASLDHHSIKVKASAICTATEIKVFADYQPGAKVDSEKAKKTVLRWLHNLEKNTKEELGLLPKPAEKKKKS